MNGGKDKEDTMKERKQVGMKETKGKENWDIKMKLKKKDKIKEKLAELGIMETLQQK